MAVIFVGNRVDSAEHSCDYVFGWIDVIAMRRDEFVCGVDEDCGEEIKDGFENGNDSDSEEYENGAGDERANDTEEKSA